MHTRQTLSPRLLPQLPPINPYMDGREFGNVLVIEDDRPGSITDWITATLDTMVKFALRTFS